MITKVLLDTEIKPKFKYYDDMKKMSRDIDENKVDYISTQALKIIKYFNIENLEAAFGEGTKDMNDWNLIVLVNSDFTAGNWKELADKRIILNKNNPLHELYVNYSLLTHDIKKITNVTYSTNYQNSILKLFFKKADVALVTRKSYDLAKELNPQVSKMVLVLEETNLSDIQLSFFRKNLDDESKKLILRTANSFDSTVEGRQILTIFKTDMLKKTEMKNLEPIKKLYDNYNKLKLEKGIK